MTMGPKLLGNDVMMREQTFSGDKGHKSDKNGDSSNFDCVIVSLQKNDLPIIHRHAERRGETVSGYLRRAALEQLQRDLSDEPPSPGLLSPELSAMLSKLRDMTGWTDDQIIYHAVRRLLYYMSGN